MNLQFSWRNEGDAGNEYLQIECTLGSRVECLKLAKFLEEWADEFSSPEPPEDPPAMTPREALAEVWAGIAGELMPFYRGKRHPIYSGDTYRCYLEGADEVIMLLRRRGFEIRQIEEEKDGSIQSGCS